MKNADLPANPTIYADMAANGQREIYCDQVGLTKREVFAMHAPDCPGWFLDKFVGDNSYISDGVLTKLNSKLFTDCMTLNFTGKMQLLKQWRYAYADLMLGEDE